MKLIRPTNLTDISRNTALLCALAAILAVCPTVTGTEPQTKPPLERSRPDDTGAAAQKGRSFSAEQFVRKTIYHSPQTPGYTCWVGAWQMPDKSLMVSFKQATGPLKDRPQAPHELLDRLGRVGKFMRENPQRDFTGLKLANIYLRSADGGTTWVKVAENAYAGPMDRPVFGGSHVALPEGVILRAIDGSQLPLVPDLPRRIYFQRSQDLGKTWGQPEIPPEPQRPMDDYLGDYGDCITRVRRLRDGRLIATGVSRSAGPMPHGNSKAPESGRPLVMFSKDEGQTWEPQSIVLSAEQQGPGVWNEWDCAELASGDLLCVFRRNDPQNRSKQVRWQGVLKKDEKSWTLENYQPSTLQHSGHPELLVTKEGIILHIATEGIHWTADAGKTWTPVAFPGLPKSYHPPAAPTSLRTRYYPRSLQTEDGRIYVFAHNGWDNAYGEFDQSIVMDTFRLKRE